MRAAVIGSPGEANGSLSMMTQLSASPTTSTPCQKLEVASRTAFGVARKSRSSAERGAVPCTSIGYSIAERGERLHLAQLGVAREQHERAPARALQRSRTTSRAAAAANSGDRGSGMRCGR